MSVSFRRNPLSPGAAELMVERLWPGFRRVFGMTYERLADFVQNRMRISHIYQPVMLMALLREGSTHIEVARATLEQEGGQGDTA